MHVKTTNKQAQDLLLEDGKQPNKVTPLLLQKKLEKDLGIDFSSYERFKKRQHKPTRHSDQSSALV